MACDAATVVPVLGDPERIHQILDEPADERDQVHAAAAVASSCAASPRRDEGVITVRDTGEGIPPEFLQHIFERFSQADRSRGRRHRGLGLGLSIVYHLVELHGGRVAAESPGPGGGTTMTVRLPLAVRRRRVAIVRAASPPPSIATRQAASRRSRPDRRRRRQRAREHRGLPRDARRAGHDRRVGERGRRGVPRDEAATSWSPTSVCPARTATRSCGRSARSTPVATSP